MKKEGIKECGIPKEIEAMKKKRENATELVFVLDKSGSMEGMEQDVIGGFNAMIEKQKKVEGAAFVSTVLFSDRSFVLHDRKPIEEIEPLTEKDYEVGGCTALLDAVGGAIDRISSVHKCARIEDVPARVLFVITTDGMENASREYGSKQIKRTIEKKQEECGWEFIFLAANIDAVETAEHIGIRQERAVNYCVREETGAMFDELSEVVEEYRTNGARKMRSARSMESNIRRKKEK